MTAASTRVQFEPSDFDICGALPEGVTVLEASAGTGKTYTIAALAARYVADGTPLERLLLVTFTRIATGELRERVRERLVSAERGLARALAGVLGEEDRLVALLADGSPEQVQERHDRLALAVASFDAATIATTHGFCQEVLGGLGIAGDLEPDVTFVEDLDDLVNEVVDDLYVRRFSHGEPPAFGRREAAAIARAAIDNPAATLVAGGSEVAQMRGRLATAARDEFERRKRASGLMSYDDLVTRLRAALAGRGGRRGSAADARPLRRSPGRRVPGHRPGAVGDPAPRVCRQRRHAGPDRRSQAGDLCLPRRRRLRLPGGGLGGHVPRHAGGQLAQ